MAHRVFGIDIGAHSLRESLEGMEKQLNEKNIEISRLHLQLQSLSQTKSSPHPQRTTSVSKSELNQTRLAMPLAGVTEEFSRIANQISRLNDYFLRATQLVTLLTHQSGETKAIRSALRKVDWDFISKEFPLIVKDTRKELREIQSCFSEVRESDRQLKNRSVETPLSFPTA